MIPSLSLGPSTLLKDCNHSGTAMFWRSAILYKYFCQIAVMRYVMFRGQYVLWLCPSPTLFKMNGFADAFAPCSFPSPSSLEWSAGLKPS